MSRSVSRRRLDGAPSALPGEVVRAAVLDRLAERWRVPVTTVVAGAGFGKSTVLAQAIRLHQSTPEGVEGYVACEPGDEDAGRLARAICAALGAPGDFRSPLEQAVEAMHRWSPSPVCLVLDDLHELPVGSSGARLVADLIGNLPAISHLVLAGRGLPGLPTARLEAAGAMIGVDAGDLAFSVDEMEALAASAGRPPESVTHLAGWPALVRLTLTAPLGAPRRFLWDEVISGLDDAQKAAMLALALLEVADVATLEKLAGVPVDLETLVAAVPLVEMVDASRIKAHQLWEDAVIRSSPPERTRDMRRKAINLLLADDDVIRAGSVAANARQADLLARPALRLVETTLGSFPADTAHRWLEQIAPGERLPPELVLLDAARRQATDVNDPDVRALIDGALADAGDDPAVARVALGLAAIAAHAVGDELRLVELAQQARTVPGAEDDGVLRLVIASVDAALAELAGDIDGAIASLEGLGRPQTVLGETAARFYLHLLVLAGRAAEAAPIAQELLAGSADPDVRVFPAFVRWLAGDPGGLLVGDPSFEPADSTNARFAFAHLAFASVILASVGNATAIDALAEKLGRYEVGTGPRDSAMLAVARAAREVVGHDEPAAAARIAELIERFPLTDPVIDVHLRRFLPYAYVLSAEARRAWDSDELGPSHLAAREVARLLLAAREGTLAASRELPEPGRVFAALPLPWTIELAARAERAGNRGAAALVAWVAEVGGERVHDELRWAAQQADGALAAGARALLKVVPERPTSTTRLEVLGPMRVLVDGEEVERSDLRRARVRELMSILAVDGSATRDRLMHLLWPDLDAEAAGRNLRVTLTYARRVVEGAPGTPPGSHLRVDRRSVRLVRSDRFALDLWDLRDDIDALRRSTAQGQHVVSDSALGRIVAAWRGAPLADLERFDTYEPEREGIQIGLIDAAIALGERRLAEGNAGEALRLAVQASSASPYSERAARLAIAAHLQRGDVASAAGAVERLDALIDELGIEPEAPTQLLLRQVERSRRR